MRHLVRTVLTAITLAGLGPARGHPARAGEPEASPADRALAEAAATDRAPGGATGGRDAEQGFRAGLRLVGEQWQDPALVRPYGAARLMAAGFAGLDLTRRLGAEIEAGYLRNTLRPGVTDFYDGTFVASPVSFLALARTGGPNAVLYAGGGPVLTVFTATDEVGTVTGTKVGYDLRAGARIHTDLVQPSLVQEGGVRGVDFEILLSRRQHQAFGVGQGFNLSAWRLAVGLVARM